jgi:hypothetical protein
MGEIMVAGYFKIALVLMIIGTMTAAQQVAAESKGEECHSIFDRDTSNLDLERYASGTEIPIRLSSSNSLPARADTLETYEIELEDEGKKGINYKAIAAVAITAAFLGYALYLFLDPGDDEEEETDGGGKPFPGAAFSIPISL